MLKFDQELKENVLLKILHTILLNTLLNRALRTLFAGLSLPLMAISPVHAGELLSFSYGPLIRSLRISSLQAFAKDGSVAEDLAFFLQFTPANKRAELRSALVQRADIDPLLVSQFFNSRIGSDVLERLGRGITLQRGGNGKFALRSALVGAAFSSDGLSLLSVLQQLPTNIQLHGETIAGAAKAGEKAIAATEAITSTMRALSAKEAAAQPQVNFNSLPNPAKPGPFSVRKEVWNLVDASRQRTFYVDVYIPEKNTAAQIPVILFSHGLASRPEDYAAGLKHLASYGYVVAAPQHPGSDKIWLKAMLQGLHQDIFDVQDFIQRPKDISYVIDELGRRNAGSFEGRLNLASVGIAGHSFGGYTALAVAGATIDFDHLQADCTRPYAALDISLLLECRALELPRKSYTLHDPRARAVVAANPVMRSIFGPKGIGAIAIPVMLASGSYDPAAPAALEQALPFTWLKEPQRYWMLLEGQAHVNFNEIDPGIKQTIESVGDLALPSQGLIGNYINATTVPFFEIHLRNNQAYLPLLSSSYAQYLSKDQKFQLFLISGTSSAGVVNAIEAFLKTHR
jgi:predicted dienelactone hydrolase